ncbi:MAG: Xaa-Pro aminopeptidase [Candidatus Methylumidiphilus alinenensis]|uniref:Xaa-Pro aminopeptidase n=1 Tax=Candidatus Methylumidiphilus alinenensis TaxID=2202197 RepID=A0A2W4TF18_9GAMM|nr:MAG: Xaa-Pro aminopeptidase [Candidatus Methylumidiphilus alinenensis]
MTLGEFKQRRKALMRHMKKNAIALLASAPAQVRNRDVEYPYRQDSDFHYLTGFDEPEAVAVFASGREQGEFILFCRKYDETKAIWTGKHAGLEGAKEKFGADEALPIEDFAETLPTLLDGKQTVNYPIGVDKELDRQVMAAVNTLRGKTRTGAKPPEEFVALDRLVHEMRLFKSPDEIQTMRKAVEVSVHAHKRAMQVCRPGMHEYQIEAEMSHECMRHGLRHSAYPSIVAGGHNACVLHYTENAAQLRDGDLLLIDAGAEFGNYAADITRTFPVNGRYSEPQRLLYELVLEAQLAAIAKIRPGNTWIQPHEEAVRVLVKGLVKLGLLQGRVYKLIRDEAYKPFFMHRTGHWLGMDVHDVGDYKIDDKWRKLEPGMVLTVEPGLYVPPACMDVDEKWRGIGIRIEDDVLVTQKGCEVLSAALPKTVAEIEAFMEAGR